MSEFKEIAKVLRDNATVNEKGDSLSVDQGTYLKILKEEGVTREHLDKVEAANSKVINGAYQMLSDFTIEGMHEAKKNGEDPKDVRRFVNVRVPNGYIGLSMQGSREFRKPNSTENVTRVGYSTMTYEKKRLIDKNLVQSTVDEIQKQFKF